MGVNRGMCNKVKASVIFSLFFSIPAILLLASGSFGSDDIGAWRLHERQAPTKDIGGIRMMPDGNLLAASSGSFHMYNGTRWKKYTYDNSVLSNHIPFFSDAQGRLYFNDDGLAIWKDGKVTRFDSIKLIDPLTAAQAGNGTVYFGSYFQETGGVYTFDGSIVVRIYEGRVRSLAVDGEGKVWVTAFPPDGEDMRLLMYDNGIWNDRTAEIETLLPVQDNSLSVQTAPDGSVWVCNEGPYGVLKDGKWDFYKNVGSGIPVSLEFDRNGGVWGYSYGNLYHLDNSGKWSKSHTYKSMLPFNTSFIAASDSAVYTFDTPDSVLVSYTNGAKWVSLPDSFDLASNRVTCLEYMNDGTLICGHGVTGTDWMDSDKRGLSIYDGSTWRNFSKYGDYSFPNVFLIKRSPVGLIYFFSDGGYFTFDGKAVGCLDSLTNTDFVATDMAWDTSGDMWIANNYGLVQFTNPGWSLTYFPGVMDPYPFTYNLCFDDNNNMYMQTWSTQVLLTDRSTWYQYIPGTGRAVNDIAVQGDGTLWGARIADLAWWNTIYQEWRTVADFPDINRVVRIDALGRVWASGYGKTGYYADGTFHTIPELSLTASDLIAFSDDGRVALNAFNKKKTGYYGIEEFIPSTVGVKESPVPAPFLTASSYPNPFNPTATIQFELPTAEKVRIAIYNVAGQKVKQLTDRRFPAGVSRVTWDSRTGAGEMASSGVYFYHIEAGKQVTVGKMLLLR